MTLGTPGLIAWPSNAWGLICSPGHSLVEFTQCNSSMAAAAVRFHDLRHTSATLLMGQGVHPKVASAMLGHSTVAITLDLYSHVIKSMQRQSAGAMDTLLAVD
jgi:integrase